MSWLVPLDIGLSIGLIFAWAVLALTIAFRLFSFPDLTIEGSLPLGAAVFATFLKGGYPVLISAGLAFIAGAAAGTLTAFLHTRFKLNKFLAGIIVVAIAYSISLRIMGASNIGLLKYSSFYDSLSTLDKTLSGYFHIGTIVFLSTILAIGISLLLIALSSRQGIELRVAGSNPNYANSLGISVSTKMMIGLALTNGMAGVSGVLLALQQGFADVSMGQGVLILALAAMTIGERLLPERLFSFPVFVVLAGIMGSIMYQVLVAFAIRFGLAATDLKLATALLVLFVVAFRISKNGELLEDNIK